MRMARLFKEQELSNILWAYGKAGLPHDALFAALLAETKARAGAFLPQGLANIAWACASVGYRDDDFLRLAVAASVDRLHTYDVQVSGASHAAGWVCACLAVRCVRGFAFTHFPLSLPLACLLFSAKGRAPPCARC